MQINDPAYRRDAIELASKITLSDLKSLNMETYFDTNLFVGYLQLLAGMNHVAIETTKQFASLKGQELPKWVVANQSVHRVIVLEQPIWDGQKFKNPKKNEDQ